MDIVPSPSSSTATVKHYIPKWVLRNFTLPLWTGDIETEEIYKERIKTAAGNKEMWSEELEQKLMNAFDDPAAVIFQQRIAGRSRIHVDGEDRRTLAHWLALFMARVPSTRDTFVEAAKDVGEKLALEVLAEHRPEILAKVKAAHPDACNQIIAELGPEAGDEWIFNIQVHRLRAHKEKITFNPQDAYEQFLSTCDLPGWARFFFNAHWQWLRTRHLFLIGDNPVVRWHEHSQNWNCGVAREVEVTFPFTSQLCLRMTRTKRDDNGRVQECSKWLTRELNRRQRLAATAYIYSGSREVVQRNIGWTVRPERYARRYRHRIPEAALASGGRRKRS